MAVKPLWEALTSDAKRWDAGRWGNPKIRVLIKGILNPTTFMPSLEASNPSSHLRSKVGPFSLCGLGLLMPKREPTLLVGPVIGDPSNLNHKP